MKEIKLIIDGKEVQLTEEQLKVLDITVKKNPFKRVNKKESYCFITNRNNIAYYYETEDKFDQSLYDCINYFNDAPFAEQVALHQLLYRKLLKFAYENDCEDVGWKSEHIHFTIYYNANDNKFYVGTNAASKYQGVYFSTSRGAARAIKEVVEPFIKEHPEFVW